MDEQLEHESVDEVVQFDTLDGDAITGTVRELRRSQESAALELAFLCEYEVWQEARSAGAFHLDFVEESPTLHPDRDVELHLRARPVCFQSSADDLQTVADQLIAGTAPLNQAESWCAIAILPAMDLPDDESGAISASTAQMGLRTTWAEWLATGEDDRSLRRVVTDYFDSEGWEYDLPEEQLVEIEIKIGGRPLTVYCYTDMPDERCHLYAVHPGTIPEENHEAVGRLLSMRNYELEYGAFGLNPTDGSVRYRRRADPERESIPQAFDATVAAMAGVYDDLWGWAADETAGTGEE